MTELRLQALKDGIGNRITLDGFQNPLDHPLSVKVVQTGGLRSVP